MTGWLDAAHLLWVPRDCDRSSGIAPSSLPKPSSSASDSSSLPAASVFTGSRSSVFGRRCASSLPPASRGPPYLGPTGAVNCCLRPTQESGAEHRWIAPAVIAAVQSL